MTQGRLKPSNDPEWLTLDQAQRLTGLSQASLSYHAKTGSIRSCVVRDTAVYGNNHPRRLLHLDDLRPLSWPRLGHVAHMLNINMEGVYYWAKHWKLAGVVRVGGHWRIRPDAIPTLADWWHAGRPVRPGFCPRQPAGHLSTD
jgi:hypothetical protein